VPLAGYEALNLEWIDTKTYLEIVEFHNSWQADAATQIMNTKEWDLYFMHNHIPDYGYHSYSTKIDPLTSGTEEEQRRFAEAERGVYRSLDRMVGRIVEAAGEDSLIVMVSDHGAKATGHRIQVDRILEEKGLIAYNADPETGARTLDWSRTKVVPQRSCYIYVNRKGRDPDGIVPDEEYEAVRDQVVSALYDYTHPETGKKPFTLVLRKEDARIIGLYGEKVGDLVYSIGPEFGGQHGPHLPTAKFGIGSLEGLLVLAGPGIKKNFVLQRNAWLTDIVPTICYLMDLPLPAQAEGAILYQALENPDMSLKEKRTLEKNLQRLKKAYEADSQLTHTYARPG
jgi:predicted AlkP superfamily phosphohydrolase/phosphomutase